MNNISVAKETLKIINDRSYMLDGIRVDLPDFDFANVQVYTPEQGKELVSSGQPSKNKTDFRISICAEDSFQAASRYSNPMVMNFANAHKPGGGFELGANAQEEALCRCSTLIASLRSKNAGEMYRYNNTHFSDVESDYMLYSKAAVFRNEKCQLIAKPFTAGVITVPAPNRNGFAVFTPVSRIEKVMLHRIRVMFMIAVRNGHKSVVLGAWGCGAFRNNPDRVAERFRKILIDEGFAGYFENICFAVYGSEHSRNIEAFRKCFEF